MSAIDVNELEAIEREAADAEAVTVDRDGPEPQSAASGISTAEQLKPLLAITCNVLAPNWKIQPEEVNALAESYGECIDYYYPELQDGLPPWLTPLLVTAAIIGPRLNMPRRVEEKEVEGERVA